MRVQQLANDGNKKIIVTFEGEDTQIEVVLLLGEADRLKDLLTAEIQELLAKRRSNIGIGI